MKSIRAILIIFLFSNLCFSQTGWYQVNSGTNKTLYSICFINLNTGFAAGEKGTILKTVTSGASWQSYNFNDTTISFLKIYFKDQSTGFALAIKEDISNIYSRIYKTTNSGNSWVPSQMEIDDVLLKNLEFVNSNVGYMSGGFYSMGANKFFKTIDGGLNWIELPTGINGAIRSQYFINENTGFICITSKLYKTLNGGTNWDLSFEVPNGAFNNSEIKFINSTTGFIGGGYVSQYSDSLGSSKRYILKTTNQGNTWNYLLNDSGSSIVSINVYSEGVMYASGINTLNFSGGFIVRTSNGGISWNNETIPNPAGLLDIKNSNFKGFAVGVNGTIFKKDNIVSVTQISTTVPSSINLYQNYPNPFNPETTIKFDISKSGFISLKVYDISGKEVQNLLNGVKEAGSYQLKFDGANLNSGVYFYKLLTNGTTITKSMVLVK